MQTPAGLYRRKLGLEPPVVVNANMARGNRLEPQILDAFNATFHAETKPVCVEAQQPLQVSLDGYARPNGSAVILEIKAPGKHWQEPPEYVAYQVAYQSAVVRADQGKTLKIRTGVAAGYETDEGQYQVAGESFDVFHVDADLDLERWLLKLSKFFWKTYIQKE